MSQPVYDLFFGEHPTALAKHPRASQRQDAPPAAVRAGWCGGRAPAIPVDAWPRSVHTGFPMMHVLTLELPPEYRRKGPELVGIALFQADDHVANAHPGVREALTAGNVADDSAFFASLLRARAQKHAEQVDLQDLIGGNFALIWLRAEELSGPRTEPPVDDRASTELPEVGQNLNAWDHQKPEVGIWLAPRAFDPNAGKAPVEIWSREDDDDRDEVKPYVESDAYVDVVLSKVAELKKFYEEHHGCSHLGGTCFPVQAMPEGLTPWFLELEDDVGGANFGGGNMQLDLESGTFDWAC